MKRHYEFFYLLISDSSFFLNRCDRTSLISVLNSQELSDKVLREIEKTTGHKVTPEQLSDKPQCREFLSSLDIDKVQSVFKTVSDGLEIDETIHRQKLFASACTIYDAATTYGENSTSCIGGVVSRLAHYGSVVNANYLDEYSSELAPVDIPDQILDIETTIPILSDALIARARGNSKFREIVESTLIMEPIDFDAPDITFEQQQFLGTVYQTLREKNLIEGTKLNLKTYELIIDKLIKNGQGDMIRYCDEYMKQEERTAHGAGISESIAEEARAIGDHLREKRPPNSKTTDRSTLPIKERVGSSRGH